MDGTKNAIIWYNRQKGGYFRVVMFKWTKRMLFFLAISAKVFSNNYLYKIMLNGNRLYWRATYQG
jgi:hypothetical protein